MKRKLLLCIFCFVAGWSAYGQKFVRLSWTDAEQIIRLAPDQALEISLPVQPSNGYGWYMKNKTNDLIEQVGDWKFVADDPNKPIGSTGNQVIRFIPKMQGKGVVEFIYKRPWEGEKTSLGHYNFTLISAGKYRGVTVNPPAAQSIAPAKATLDKHEKSMTSTNSNLPSSFSWLSQGICTVVKDQGQCGSCWAFAACGSFEAVINYYDHNVRDLAEQWLVNCDNANQGCSGGWCPFNMFQSPGSVYETDQPYTAQNGTCASSYTYHEQATGYQEVATNPTVAQIKQAIYDYGPVWSTIDAGNNFQNYSGGILRATDGTNNDHAIVLVGWSDADSCWILRNSWGTSWGENQGYMRIGWGVSNVGYKTTYITYRGIISHNNPPAPAFVASAGTTCSGTVQFTDGSSNSPTSWLWHFGDGQTSTQQNPSHTYANSGVYSVTLVATNSYGSDSLVRNNMVTVNLMSAPTTTGDTRTGPGVVNLSASASNAASLDWYDAATAGNLVNTGATYAPTINATTTYYVANENLPAPQNVGLANNSAGGGYYTANTDRRLYFNVQSPMVLNSVTIYANTAGNRQIVVLDSAGNIIQTSAVFNATAGTNVVPLNFNISAGNNYAIKLSSTSGMDLFRNNTGVSYPYTINNLVSITGSDAPTNPGNYYYYFYNWQVQEPGCSSTRTPVTGTVTPLTGVLNVSANNALRVYPNPGAGLFTFDGLEGDNNLEVFDVVGNLIYQGRTAYNTSFSLDLRGKDKGVYFYRLSNLNSKNIKTGKVIIY